jgi:LPXTG-motif cell wall-anchored protein
MVNDNQQNLGLIQAKTLSHHNTKTFFGKFFAIIGALILALAFTSNISMAYAAAPTEATEQCNDADNVGGLAISCTVDIVNNYNAATQLGSSTMVIEECHGAAGAEPTCITVPSASNTLITSVTQCNGSGNGGGATVRCDVNIVNNITGTATATSATVNQCNEAGQEGGTEPTILCNPLGDTVNADVIQCNQSGNGGGGTERVRCNVITSSTVSDVLPININQCIGSGNGGGAIVECNTSIQNIITAIEVPVPTDEPTTPTEPSDNPSVPTDEPTTPTEPSDNPSVPTDTPSTPVDVPATPDVPTDTPDVPSDTPSTPVDTPATPDVPSDTPRGPSQPNTPSNNLGGPNAPQQNLAYTGSESAPILFAAGGGVLLGGILLMLSSRRTKLEQN